MTANRHTFPRSSLALSLALACGSILLSVSTARGAPTPAHWLGGSGDWSDPAHWDIGVVPNNTGPSTYGVTIEGPAEDLVVTVSKGITVSRIVSTERIQVAGGGTLAVLGILVNAGEIVAAGGTVRLDNTTADNAGGTIVADGGVVEVVNSTINGGVLRATDKATSLVRFSGDVTLNGVPWVDDGAGEFQIINTKARMLGDYAHRLPAGYRLVLISTYGHFATAQWTVAEGEFVNHGVIE
ncbi:MAG: hypothetical protein HYY24_24170, partial [Verrucomicrobia bacterium]|nr:hypothetical protein [Verrucomicrobiota bacterium]